MAQGRERKAGAVPGATRHVAITGASSGLGRALAELYAAQGCRLSLAGRDPGRLAAVAAACRARGAEVDACTVDVVDPAAMHDWLVARDADCGIDILIANAGMGGSAVLPPPHGEDGALARRILSVNTAGMINSVTPLLSRMVSRAAGHIVLVGSISGAIGLPQSPVYCASKAAVQIYGDALRRLVREHGVRVTNVLPGFIDTPMSRSLGMARPWCWTADRAARRIARDVARGRPRCIFPWQLRWLIALQSLLPLWLSDAVLSAASRRARRRAEAGRI
ncbi:SDR family NAD(P)-dependent oxidoreductase [Reyranella sp.]|uniref:SDR family NAD(P)-dependent oxidoreductase n=1 Tax=Reyranella sp. TaxID=1929291 RepID=UPI003D0FE244